MKPISLKHFLDVTFNLATGKFYSFRKPNNQRLYINAKSNHPLNILRDLRSMINKRLSDLSCNKEDYEKAKPMYETALNESGYKATLTYTKTTNVNNRNRAHNIVWFNPPYSQNVKANIGKTFLKLVEKHFPRGHKLYKTFNRNTLKLSYSCMSSMSSVIKQHNYRVLSTTENVDWLCNCRNKENCPLEVKCLQSCIVYKVDVITNKGSHIYYGASDGAFKYRYNNHTNSFTIDIKNKTQNFQNISGTTRKRCQLQSKMECRSLCLNIQMWVKKVWPMFNGEVRDSKS